MIRNTFGTPFTAAQVAMASLLGVNLNDPLSLRRLTDLPRGYKPKRREAVARSRYTPAGPNCNTHTTINSRRIRARQG